MAQATTFPIAAALPAETERVDPLRLLAFLAMCFGMFMAFLDIQVVSASLSEIQAGLAASSDEITWVQTSYLMAEVVAIPLSGFLARALGTRIMFATAAAGFTIASLMCGLSSSMGEMILVKSKLPLASTLLPLHAYWSLPFASFETVSVALTFVGTGVPIAVLLE